MAEAPLLFSGPGSPTYALRQWAGTLVPGLLAEKLALGGAVTFASAAALTLGALTVPVYEIYKVGEDPRWVDGLDLMAGLGIPAVVIPHYDNAEGGTHDTRYCYLGEERLAFLEGQIPEGCFVLGVDEHTAIIFDLDSGEATVAGRGHVTVRVKGRSAFAESGEVVPVSRLLELASGLAEGLAEGGVSPAGMTASSVASVDGSRTGLRTSDPDLRAGRSRLSREEPEEPEAHRCWRPSASTNLRSVDARDAGDAAGDGGSRARSERRAVGLGGRPEPVGRARPRQGGAAGDGRGVGGPGRARPHAILPRSSVPSSTCSCRTATWPGRSAASARPTP